MVKWVLLALALAGFRPLVGQNTFQKQITGVNGVFSCAQTADDHFWLGTYLGKILRLDADGQWLGGATLHKGDTTESRFIYDLERAPDNGVWALYDRNNDKTALDDYLILARLNASGQPLWQTSVHYGEVLHWAHNRLASDPTGNAYVISQRFSSVGSSQPNRTIFSKVAPDGTLKWVKAFINQGANYSRAFQRLSDGSFLICGNGQLASSFGFLLRVSAEGEVLWSRRYARFLFKAFAEMPDGSWTFAATEAGPLPQANCVLRIDVDGNILWAKRLAMPAALNWIPALVLAPSGDVLIGNFETRKDQPVPDLICLSADGDFRWAKRYDVCQSFGISNLLVTNDGGIAALRFRASGHLLLKTDALGHCATCPDVDMTIGLENLTDFPLEYEWQVEDRPLPGKAECDYDSFVANIADFCGQEKPVTGIAVNANILCRYKTLTANAVGPGVPSTYNWFFSGGAPAALSGTPVVGGIQFANPGPATVTLTTTLGFCKDTFTTQIQVLPGPAPIDLGPDTTVCGILPLVFDATTDGAQSYLWNDGSTLPQHPAGGSGEYSVTAAGGGCTVNDTVRFQRLEGLSVRLPGDTMLCGQDTLWIDASTLNGEQYHWSDGFDTPRRPVTEAGTYAVSVFRGECTASDFMAVDFFPHPPALPADTTLCVGEPLRFSVGRSAAGEVWWNGQHSYADFSFEGAGWVQRLITYRGCRFVDSVFVQRADCQKGFALYTPNAFSPNGDGQNDFFELFGDGLEVLQLQVFDRWGALVFDQTGITDGWDGTNRGRALPTGVYLWRAQLRQRNSEGWLEGDVLLVR